MLNKGFSAGYCDSSARSSIYNSVFVIYMWMSDFFWGNGFSSLFSILFFLLFFSILGLFFYTFIQGIRQWNKNNHSPRLTVDATVVTKRTDVSNYHHPETHTSSRSTTYYVTFQVDSGDRMEFVVDDSVFGMLVEGDKVPIFVRGDRSILDFNPLKNRNLLFDPYKTRIFFI